MDDAIRGENALSETEKYFEYYIYIRMNTYNITSTTLIQINGLDPWSLF
jgi:hypothetical protein